MHYIWTKLSPKRYRHDIETSKGLKKIASNVGWMFIERFVRMGLTLVITSAMARYLGSEQFGLLNYALAFVTLFSIFANLGLDGIVTRDIVSNVKIKDETIGTAFILRLVSSIFTIALIISVIWIIEPDYDMTRWLVAITSLGLLFRNFEVIDLWFQSQVASKYSTIAKVISFSVICLGKIYLIFLGAPLVAFAWISIAEYAINSAVLIILYTKTKQSLTNWTYKISRGKELLIQSWPLILSSLSVVIYLKIDQIMLGQMVNSKAVGVYSAIVPLSEVWYFIPAAIVTSFTPYILQAKKVSEVLYYRNLQQLFKLVTVLAFFVAVPMTFLSEPMVVFLFGEEYRPGGLMLAIHIWACIFVGMGLTQTVWDINEELTKLKLQRTVISAILNILLNLVLIPQYLGVGAALATVIAQATSCFLLNFLNTKTRKIFFMEAKALFIPGYFL